MPSHSIPVHVWSPAAWSAGNDTPLMRDSDTCDDARLTSPFVNTAAVIVNRRDWMPEVNVIVARATCP